MGSNNVPDSMSWILVFCFASSKIEKMNTFFEIIIQKSQESFGATYQFNLQTVAVHNYVCSMWLEEMDVESFRR